MPGNGYSRAVRAVDVSSMVVFFGLMTALALRLSRCLEGSAGWLAPAVFLAYVAADLVSGLFHWIGDTWGGPRTPVAGKLFIRAFREHHVDQLAITGHDFVEVNGASCLICTPVAAATHMIPFAPDEPGRALVGIFLGAFLCWIFATNQFHKWAHMDAPPWPARWLQRCHLILPAEHHRIHHVPPHDKYYCITVGWLNEPLNRLRFFVALEHLIRGLTGMRPRDDDVGARHLALHDSSSFRAVLPG